MFCLMFYLKGNISPCALMRFLYLFNGVSETYFFKFLWTLHFYLFKILPEGSLGPAKFQVYFKQGFRHATIFHSFA